MLLIFPGLWHLEFPPLRFHLNFLAVVREYSRQDLATTGAKRGEAVSVDRAHLTLQGAYTAISFIVSVFVVACPVPPRLV